MGNILAIVFFLALFIQAIFWLFVHSKLLSHRNRRADPSYERPGISIVIAAWNEIENLKELIPLLEKQDYPDFEIIVADDRSFDGTYDLLWIEKPYPKTQIVRIDSTPTHFTSKKYAVTMGIKKASKPLILLLDADCRPRSDQWLSEMETQHLGGNSIVLGFSPYFKAPGWLNRLIRFETLHTAIQYLSYAKAKVPFMGVGRNLMYSRNLFWSANGFASHYGVMGGDDDLFINQVSTGKNTTIATNKKSLVYSVPKTTWSEWYIQKKRHLSVGKFYKGNDKFRLGVYAISHVLTWVLPLFVFLHEPGFFQTPEWAYVPYQKMQDLGLGFIENISNWKRLILSITLVWFLIKWILMTLLNNKLHKTLNSSALLFLDACFALYLIIFAFISFVSRRQVIRWK